MEIPKNPWQGTNENALKILETSPNGLSQTEAQKRHLEFGSNTIAIHAPVPFLQIFFDQFIDLLVLLLIFAAVLSFVLGDNRSGIIISIIVFINALIGFTQEYKAQRILKALNKLLPSLVKVKRMNVEKEISANYLVPGDIVLLGPGDKVPADMRLIECYDFRVDEKILTGENQPQTKDLTQAKNNHNFSEVKNMIYMGTTVADGEAIGVVTAIGLFTEFGKIAKRTTSINKNLSPLQEKTKQMSKKVALLAAFVVIALVIYKYFLDRNIVDAFIFSIAVAAALVPEGLPATISVALSLGASKLAKKKALVKNLVSVETLGSVTIICTDKTGTLTTGKMEVKEIWDDLNEEISKVERKKLFSEAIVLCNDAQIGKNVLGDPLEIALLNWAQNSGANIEEIRRKYQKTNEIPFNSVIKYMSVSFKDGTRIFSYLKGAPEVLIKKCKLSSIEKEIISNKVEEIASSGFRVLAVAYNEIFLGLVTIYDPPRSEVKGAIKDCRMGSIKILMITGDNPTTAVAIAKETGVTTQNDPKVILGEQIDRISDTELRSLLLEEPIFARTLPEHKFRIVDNLMKMGEIVAVTGDGVNDAPALKRSDIGIAMGQIGSDVSREAADLVLMDDNFATIVTAVKEGRSIFDNIKKFLFYIFSSNFGELLTVIIGVVAGLPLPITAIQILSVDLGTDVLPSMALIFEPPESQIMKTKPRSKDVKLLDGESFLHLTLIGLVMGFGAIGNFLFIMKSGGNYHMATTASLATLVISQSFNAFLSRCPETTIFRYPLFKNKFLLFAEFFSTIMILSIVYLKVLNNFVATQALPPYIWWRIISVGVILLIFEETYKLVKRSVKERSFKKKLEIA